MLCAHMSWCNIILLLLLLIHADITTQINLTDEQKRQIDVAKGLLPNMKADLCPTSCSSVGGDICPTTNPCKDMHCQTSPNAVCIFCCCNSPALWTSDGQTTFDCPTVTITQSVIQGGSSVTIRGSNPTPNPSIPIPFAYFARNMLPPLELSPAPPSPAQGGTVTQTTTISVVTTTSPQPDCFTVLRMCARAPWLQSCKSCIQAQG